MLHYFQQLFQVLQSNNLDITQGSEEIFNIDPLPPRSHPADSENHSVSYISHPRISQSEASQRGGQDREDDEMMQQEEVGSPLRAEWWSFNQCRNGLSSNRCKRHQKSAETLISLTFIYLMSYLKWPYLTGIVCWDRHLRIYHFIIYILGCFD